LEDIRDVQTEIAEKNSELNKRENRIEKQESELKESSVIEINTKTASKTIKIIKEFNVDVIESHGYKAHFVAFFASRWTRRPWISYVHGWTQENRKVLFYNWTEKIMVRLSNLIIAVSQDMKKRLQLSPSLSTKAIVIKNSLAIDPVETASASALTATPPPPSMMTTSTVPSKNDFVILTVGRLSPEKGFVYLIRAVALLRSEIPELKLIIVGDGPERVSEVANKGALQCPKQNLHVGLGVQRRRLRSADAVDVPP
jgi:glycosyltransferase involved in cell wall biosynthesis